MAKKLLMALVAVLAVAGGIAALSAYEAHVINVTAHIENAMDVSPEAIDFGTVFPEETFHRTFQVNCSTSFIAEDRVDDIHYKVVLKPKPLGDPRAKIYPESFPNGIVAWDYCLNETEDPEYLDFCYRDLCPFLQMMASEGEGDSTTSAYLAKTEQDCEDTWSIGFDVPCISGYTPQGDPCQTIPENDKDWGCDIWVEGIGISEMPR